MNYQNTKNEQLRGFKAHGKRVPSGKTYMSSLLEKRNRGVVILFFLCAASILVKIHIGFDVDEQYAFSMMFRFSQGQMYLVDLFDPYQFSALLMTPLFALCRLLSEVNAVFLFRLFSGILYFAGTVPVYRFVYRETNDQKIAILSGLFVFTFSAKSIISLEHSNLTALFLLYVLMDLYDYLRYGRLSAALFALKSFLLAVCYPTMVLLVVPVLVLFFRKKDYRRAGRYLLWCALFGMVLIVPALVGNGGFHGLTEAVHMILLDESHQYSLGDRMDAFRSELRYAFRYLAGCAVCFIVLLGWRRIDRKPVFGGMSKAVLFCAGCFLFAMVQVWFKTVIPFYGYYRYFFLVVIALYAAYRRRRRPLIVCLWVLMAALLIVFQTTNNGALSVCGFCGFAMVALVLLMQEDPKGIKVLLASAIVCQCSYDVLSYRVSGGSPASTLHSDLVQSKAVGQIWIEPADEAFFEQCSSETLKSKSQDVMIGSNNSYAYVLVGGSVFAPTTTGTPFYGAQWETYIENADTEDFDLLIQASFDEAENLVTMVRKYYDLQTVSSDGDLIHYVAVKKDSSDSFS